MQASADEEVLLRPLGTHERYSLIRHNLSYPPNICCAAVGRGGDDVIDKVRSSLHRKISALLESPGNTLLSAHIHQPRSRTARYARRSRGVKVEEVLYADNIHTSLEPDQLLTSQIKANTTDFDVQRAPLWNVKILREGHRFAIVVNCHHLIMDGKGIANLFEILLSSSDELPALSLLSGGITSLEEAPPTVEDSVPGYDIGFLRKAAISAYSMIPASIRYYLEKDINWPASATLPLHPTAAIDSHHVILLKGGSVLSNLKHQANKHGIKTIHPLIHMACVLALYKMLPSGTPLSIESPINERIASERHTLCTGNYISVHFTPMTLSGGMDTWNEARLYARKLLTQRSAARQIFGEIGFIMKETDKVPFEANDKCSSVIENIFYQKQCKKNPYRSALGLSNLGSIKGIPDYIDDVFWSQLSSPIGGVFTVNVCGFGDGDKSAITRVKDEGTGVPPPESAIENITGKSIGRGGLAVTVAMRRGTIDEEMETKFLATLEKSLRAFEAGIDEGATLGEVVRSM